MNPDSNHSEHFNETNGNRPEAPRRAEHFGPVLGDIGIGLPIAEESSPHHHSYGSVSGGSADPRDRHPIQMDEAP